MNARKKLPSKFTKDRVLPVGDYELTPEELLSSMLVTGPKGLSKKRRWNSERRLWLAKNAIKLIKQLWHAGINDVFIDGSFVEDKDSPNDIDGYFDCTRVDIVEGKLAQRLNRSGPFREWCWDWSSRIYLPGNKKPQLPMWRDFRVELFPNYGQPSGIFDKHGSMLTFPASFRTNRQFVPKGIIKIVPQHDSD